MRQLSAPPIVEAGLLALIGAIAVLIYLPGLSGPFLFDDFGSLSRLGDFGGVRNWATFKAFVLNGDAGPTGRPISLLAFLVDGTTWPTDAWPFKRTNLILHLLNGAVLFVLTRQILGLLAVPRDRAAWIALSTAALWLLHPFLVSTTLYAVQRMAQLAAFFCLAGLSAYLHGRQLIGKRPLQAYLTMSAGIGAGTMLALLSKENGILLPLLAIVLEVTVIAARQPSLPAPNRAWVLFFLGLPVIAVAAYLAKYVYDAGLFTLNPTRGYSVYERLLTQPRVLTEYLTHWFVPSPVTNGVFQDHVTPSRGIMTPPSTLMAILLHLGLLSFAIGVRRRWPAAAFALLFFYAAHLLESSVINLELYFEHRNYLAAAFLFLPLVMIVDGLLSRGLFVVVTAILLAMLGSFTRETATVWSSYESMVRITAASEPDSARAQQQLALQLYNAGSTARALEVIDAGIERRPEEDSLYLTKTLILCTTGTLRASDLFELGDVVGRQPYDPRLLSTYESLFKLVESGACPAYTIRLLDLIFERMLEVPVNANPLGLRYFQIQYFLGRADLLMDDAAAAEEHLFASLNARPTANRAMLMAALMANAAAYPGALHFTEEALRMVTANDVGGAPANAVRRKDILDFQNRLREAMAADRAGLSEPEDAQGPD